MNQDFKTTKSLSFPQHFSRSDQQQKGEGNQHFKKKKMRERGSSYLERSLGRSLEPLEKMKMEMVSLEMMKSFGSKGE